MEQKIRLISQKSVAGQSVISLSQLQESGFRPQFWIKEAGMPIISATGDRGGGEETS
jgi:hypothetical protein